MPRKRAYLLFLLLSLLVAGGSMILRYFLQGLPNVDALQEYLPQMTTRIYGAKGELVTELFTERRVWVPLNQIPVDLQNAFIAIEDDRFFKHRGISPQGMLRAAVKNFLAGRVVQGGSTITQQLSKLIFLTQEKTLIRKIRELILALQVEYRFSKEEILQMYLNQVYFGHGAYGVSAAARTFFAKTVQDLDLAECALLAGIPRLPSYYSPIAHPERAKGRRSVVLARMRELKYIGKEEEEGAKKRPLNALQAPLGTSVAAYFVEYLRQDLETRYSSDELYRGGLSVYTTLDLEMQNQAERAMAEALEQFDKEYGPQAEALRAKEKTMALRKSGAVSKNFTVKPSTTVTKVQGSVVALEPKTGAIRAMVGGRNFAESQFNRVVQAKRQPGSAFKPFVWIAALENRFTPASLVDDLPLAYFNDGRDWRLLEGATDAMSIRAATAAFSEGQTWVPKNFDGRYFGPITLRKGLAFSRNLVSVRLIDQVDPRRVVEWARKMGVRSPLDPVLSLSLGTSVLTLLELTNAFGCIAAEGILAEPYAIAKVVNFEGRVLEQRAPQEAEVVDPRLNYLITSLLKGVVLEGTARGARALGRPVAGKTGTTQDQRDLWFVGFTPDLACGAWMGYDDFSPLGKKMSSGGVLVPWWTAFMRQALASVPARDFPVPDGITFVKIDANTGLLAAPGCPRVILESFFSGTEPKDFCDVDHTAQKPPEIEGED